MAKDAKIKAPINKFEKIIASVKPTKQDDFQKTMAKTMKSVSSKPTGRTMGDNIKKKASEGNVAKIAKGVKNAS